MIFLNLPGCREGYNLLKSINNPCHAFCRMISLIKGVKMTSIARPILTAGTTRSEEKRQFTRQKFYGVCSN